MDRLQLWGGLECTLNRVGETFRDQLSESGHYGRPADLDLFADLGITAIRYPVLWEHVSPERPDLCRWDWVEARLDRLRALGVKPIVGLVHHGSGPSYTNLLANDFASGLARHARHVAERFPWIEDWTPVNEPLTTARFSALYGHWYPHRRDERSFWLALINQIDGVRLSMDAVRRINPHARLIQTDDLGRTYATVALRDQAAFDNVRRWMGWDLLCGRVVPGHCLWKRLCGFGLEERLRAIADAPCPPDVIGVNHYLTSDRFLDHRIRNYPDHARGSNDQQRYADVEAIRVLDPPPSGLTGVLREAWQRYRIPLAVTEVHNGCTREQQMRWMVEAWCAAETLRDEGAVVTAVTAWSLLGSHGWDTLLTSPGRYEPGVYDIASGVPRPTAMVGLLQRLVQQSDAPPACDAPGWWRRLIRFHHPAVSRAAPMRDHHPVQGAAMAAPLLLVDEGDAAPAVSICDHRGLRAIRVSSPNSPARVSSLLDHHRPWAVLCGTTAAPAMASACARHGIAFGVLPTGEAELHHLLDGLIDQAAMAAA